MAPIIDRIIKCKLLKSSIWKNIITNKKANVPSKVLLLYLHLCFPNFIPTIAATPSANISSKRKNANFFEIYNKKSVDNIIEYIFTKNFSSFLFPKYSGIFPEKFRKNIIEKPKDRITFDQKIFL